MLTPPSVHLLHCTCAPQAATRTPQLSSLLSAVASNGLAPALSNPNLNVTVFAPVNVSERLHSRCDARLTCRCTWPARSHKYRVQVLYFVRPSPCRTYYTAPLLPTTGCLQRLQRLSDVCEREHHRRAHLPRGHLACAERLGGHRQPHHPHHPQVRP